MQHQTSQDVLEALEQRLDQIVQLNQDYFTSAQKDYTILASIAVTADNYSQLVRLYKKFTWLQVHPRDYVNGLWKTF